MAYACGNRSRKELRVFPESGNLFCIKDYEIFLRVYSEFFVALLFQETVWVA